MKLERWLSIIIYLLNHEKAKAQELADKFEVSVRTVYRDIDSISQAGIPIATYQGADGGIGIVDGYKLDRSIFTGDEVIKIVAGLKGLQSISDDVRIRMLIEKLTGIANKSDYIPTGNEIMIDLSSWNKNDQLGLRIREIKKAIQERKILEFTYYNNEVVTERRVEPGIIVFKEAHWYLYAFCLLRNDFRLFKLRRMSRFKTSDDGFEARDFQLDNMNWNGEFREDGHAAIVVLFDRSMEYVAHDIFGAEKCETVRDGRVRVTFQMDTDGWLYSFILGFGDKIEVLEPAELRNKIRNMAENIYTIYRG